MNADGAFDLDRISAIRSRLDLRRPNVEALESIVFELRQHYEIEGKPPTFEAVVDSATGVGKTYILAAAVEYLAGDGGRNFAIITPGRTILEKTVANFTPGHPKSLLGGMDVSPVLITSDNFNTPAMRTAMDDPAQVKLYVFTVQSLIRPQSKAGRKTHKFQEGLGEAFYAHLQSLSDLVVFADEHHTYYGDAFSQAVRDLRPWALIGLTATPHRRTPPDQIIYRYPLAAAIADRLVKTPVLVGRKDDRRDPETKLLDGVRLLELKERVMARWYETTGQQPVRPVMLVVAPSIAEAREIEQIVKDAAFAGGQYADQVLTVHSDAPDEALAQLETVESPDSPYRIIVSVGMLKEGWDVKNVYVIASLRASVSDILTEQTLGRGLRLPFREYTGVELLDTLEVLGHERYEELLRKAGVINEQFIDLRTRAVLRRNAEGQLVSVTETTTVQAPVVIGEPAALGVAEDRVANPPTSLSGRPEIQSMEAHTERALRQAESLQVQLVPRTDVPPLRVPRLLMEEVHCSFSLADITDYAPFRQLGESIGADPAAQLRRVLVSARVVEGADGLRHTELVTSRAVDVVSSPGSLLSHEDARRALIDHVLTASVIPARANQRAALAPIVDAFMRGLGDQADTLLSGYLDRAAAGLIQRITEEQRRFMTVPSYGEVVELVEFGPRRLGRPETSRERFSAFKVGVGYEGCRKSLYAQDWFDSSTERDVANLLEDDAEIVLWVRLQRGDLPILWATGREYNPDFIAIDQQGIHWIVEAKMDREMLSEEVQGKREAARRWANHVSADDTVGATWRYLLVSETDVQTAKETWDVLKRFA